jgi:hypothetical protein
VEARGRNDHPTLFERALVGVAGQEVLGASADHALTLFDVFGPDRQQTPAECIDASPPIAVLNDDVDVAGGAMLYEGSSSWSCSATAASK